MFSVGRVAIAWMLFSASTAYGTILSMGLSMGLFTGSFTGSNILSGKKESVHFSEASHATVLVFISAKCPCSESHEPVLEALRSEFEPKGIRFFGIHSNADEPLVRTQQHFKKSPIRFPILRDEKAVLANELKALKTPHAYLFNRSGEILYQGGVDDSQEAIRAQRHYLREALQAVVVGKAVETAQTRTLGCVIARPLGDENE